MKLWDRSYMLPDEHRELLVRYWTNDVPVDPNTKNFSGVTVILPIEPRETILDRAIDQIIKHVDSYTKTN